MTDNELTMAFYTQLKPVILQNLAASRITSIKLASIHEPHLLDHIMEAAPYAQ